MSNQASWRARREVYAVAVNVESPSSRRQKATRPTGGVKNIKEYYLAQGAPHIGQDFVASIVEQVETLSSHPDISRVVLEFNDESIRELIHSPFRVVYLRELKSIKVIRVWRSERMLKLPENE